MTRLRVIWGSGTLTYLAAGFLLALVPVEESSAGFVPAPFVLLLLESQSKES